LLENGSGKHRQDVFRMQSPKFGSLGDVMGTARFENLKIIDYSDIRGQIRTGDILFASGNYPVSRIIEHFSDSMFSHVGFIFTWNERVLLLESVEDDGVRATPLSQYVTDYECSGSPYDGRLFLARYNTELDQGKINIMLGEAADLLNRKYNKEEIGEIIARVTIGLGHPIDNNTYICSEFVDVCFRKIGIKFNRAAGDFIFPEQIAIDPNITPWVEIGLTPIGANATGSVHA
jgi:hypothetical protein